MHRTSAEGNVMKEVISELLQRKEQQEEDVYFESLNREAVEKLHRQAVTGDRSAFDKGKRSAAGYGTLTPRAAGNPSGRVVTAS